LGLIFSCVPAFISDLKMHFRNLVREIRESLAGVERTIKDYEIDFLALIAAYPATGGCVLEIGAFKGASTIVLSKAARAAGDDHIWTVDPFTNPCETDLPEGTCYHEFQNNLQRAGMETFVKVFKGLSQDLAKEWREPIRVLWIDGDHRYAATKHDFELFRPFLADGALVAFHDVLGWQPGPCRVFANDVLGSEDFSACGLSGTIGWAQFVKDRQVPARHSQTKAKLRRALAPQISATAPSMPVSRIARWRQLLLRNRHRQSLSPKQFLQRVEVLR
jgi:predicted O-methyltransferase YrrM